MGSYGPPPKQFVHFKKLKRKPKQKTDRWEILDHTKQIILGIIRFYPQWRCYISEEDKNKDIVMSGECHIEIGNFCIEQTKLWRESKLKKK